MRKRKKVNRSAVVREAFAVLGPNATTNEVFDWASSEKKVRLKSKDISTVRSQMRADANRGVVLADTPDTPAATEAVRAEDGKDVGQTDTPENPVAATQLVPVAAPLLPVEFFYEDDRVLRTIFKDGVVWFVARDACSILGIQNSRDAVGRLEESEKGVGQIDTPGGTQTVSIINDSGLYCLSLRSDKPQARRFRLWVTSDVLPTIRDTGQYECHAGKPASTQPASVPSNPPRKPRAIPDVTTSLKRLTKIHGVERVVTALDALVGRVAQVAV